MYVKELGLTSAYLQGHIFITIAHPIAKLQKIYLNTDIELLYVYL